MICELAFRQRRFLKLGRRRRLAALSKLLTQRNYFAYSRNMEFDKPRKPEVRQPIF